MVAPLILGAMLAGLAVSAGANLYSQHNQRDIWEKQANAYEHLDKGYRRYLSSQGKEVNPNRAWTSYFGQAQALRNNIANSYAHSVGTIGGSVGAGLGISKESGIFDNLGKTKRWL